jgi:hypothetical protein
MHRISDEKGLNLPGDLSKREQQLRREVLHSSVQAEVLKEASATVRQQASNLSEMARGLNRSSKALREQASRLRAQTEALRVNRQNVVMLSLENSPYERRDDSKQEMHQMQEIICEAAGCGKPARWSRVRRPVEGASELIQCRHLCTDHLQAARWETWTVTAEYEPLELRMSEGVRDSMTLAQPTEAVRSL